MAFEKDGKPRTAIELFQRVLDRDDLSPTCRAWALRNVSQPMLEIGDTDAAMEAIKEAIGLDPVQPWNFYSLSRLLGWSGRFEEALTPARQASVLEPWDYRHRLAEGLALLGLGRFDEALEPIVKACSGSRSQEAWGARAVCLAGAGQTDEAASAASEALRLTESFDGAVLLARYSLMTGDRAEALRLLQRAVDLGLANPSFVDGFDELAGDAEFEAVVQRIKERVGDRP